ncbi:MAG: hypothetical protein ABSE82_10850 [Nitrososphaerales archaeon]|jgi:membrane-anchored glycerophosphoryl diester phosphodiesterase (GDPDase)
MIDGNNPPFTEEESKAISLAVLDIMMLMRQLDEKGISFRCALTAFLFTINSSFEVLGYSKVEVKNLFQNMINGYEEYGEEVKEEA